MHDDEEKYQVVLEDILIVQSINVGEGNPSEEFHKDDCPNPSEHLKVFHWQIVEYNCPKCSEAETHVYRLNVYFAVVNNTFKCFWKTTAQDIEEVHSVKRLGTIRVVICTADALKQGKFLVYRVRIDLCKGKLGEKYVSYE